MKKILFAGLIALFLAGCGEEVKSVQYYIDNPAELDKALEQCREMSAAEAMASENCAHVNEAIRRGQPKKNMTFPK